MHTRFNMAIRKVSRAYSSLPGVAIIQTRIAFALLILVLACFPNTFDNPTRIAKMMVVYIGLTLLLLLLSRTFLERSRLRAVRDLFDLITISFLVKLSGGLDSPWFLLYFFPVMSAARYLGYAWSLAVTVFSAATYAYAGSLFNGSASQVGSFCLRIAVMGGVALTAASLARTRDRAEARLISALETIDLKILTDDDSAHVMNSILNTAAEITGSDLSALRLCEAGNEPQTFAVARTFPSDSTKNAVEILRMHYGQVLRSAKPLALPQHRPIRAVVAMLKGGDNCDYWPARLVPLQLDGPPFGVIAVFSRRILRHYTSNDVRKLSSMAPLLAMVQKNSVLYQALHAHNIESKERLQMLYEIGDQLRSEQEPELLFETVVRLVSQRLQSEEAALFVPKDAHRLVKVAVSGPNEDITGRLRSIEQFYEAADPSLTRRVFETKEPLLENSIALNEDYAAEYSKHLPSGMTKHYIGVPLLIGDEVLGVIRVLNKKAHNYSVQIDERRLVQEGFKDDDLDLLIMIGIQVAAAIRSAKFIERNRYFENLVYKSPHPIIVVDEAGRVQNFNRECEKLWGLKETEVRGNSVEMYYESSAVAREIGQELWNASSKMIRDRLANVRDGRGNLVPIRLSAALLLDKKGKSVGSIGVFTDEREILRQEEDRVRAEKLAAIGRIAYTTGHDIKQDLGTIRNYAEALEGRPEDALVHQAALAIRDATAAILSKLQNMLMAAKPKPPNKQIVAVKPILMQFVAAMRNRTLATHVTFSATYPDSDALVLVDPDQLKHVLANLLSNSLDAIKTVKRKKNKASSGRIELRLEIEKDMVSVLWSDDGPGMSAKAMANAFAPFFTTKETGSGLGLFITKNIVENHNGEISVESAGDGGTRFRITLPRFVDSEHRQVPAAELSPVSQEAKA